MINLTVALVSVVLGAILGGVIQTVVGRYVAFKASQGVAGALRAEIGGLLGLVKVRQYRPQLDQIIARLSRNTYSPSRNDIFRVRVTQDYFTVFKETCSQIGTLGTLAPRVVLLYVVGKGFLEDVAELRELWDKVSAGQAAPDREYLLGISTALRDLLVGIEIEGPQVVQSLDEYSSRRWIRVGSTRC